MFSHSFSTSGSRSFLLLLIMVFVVQMVAVNRAVFATGPLIDLNSANAGLLAGTLPGIGPTKAEAIVDYRDRNGPYKTIDALIEVKGIGEKTLIKIRPFLFVGEPGQEQSGLYPSINSRAKSTILNLPSDEQRGDRYINKPALSESEADAHNAVQAALKFALRFATTSGQTSEQTSREENGQISSEPSGN